MKDTYRSLFDDLDQAAVTLDDLFTRQLIAIRRGKVFDFVPASIDIAADGFQQRVQGMLIGVAAGDALGHCTEWRYEPKTRYEEFGTIVDHLHGVNKRAGLISDDTQMTFWKVQRLIALGKFDFDDVVRCFVDHHDDIVGMGINTSASLKRHQDRLESGQPSLYQCAGDPIKEGRGNGALMRFSPIVLPYLKSPSSMIWQDAVMSAFITHGHACALASVVPMTHLLWEVLRSPSGEIPKPSWWIDEYLKWGGDLETEMLHFSEEFPIPKAFVNFRGTLCDFLDGPLRNTFRKGVPLRDACSLSGFGSRADVVQTLPAVLYTLMCHGDSLQSSIIAAVNDTKDNDTIAAIVGAFVGAIHGRQAIRAKWIDGICSYSLKIDKLTTHSDKSVIELLAAQASEKFCAR